MADSPSAPTPPDPIATSQAQQQLNDQAARLNTTLNRYNQVTPLGNQTWTNNSTFDQAGFDAAMQAYQQSLAGQTAGAPAPAPAASNAGFTSPSGEAGYEDWSARALNQASAQGAQGTSGTGSGTTLTAPNRADYTSGGDNWTSTTTLDPRVQQLLDNQLQTSTNLQGSVDSALQRVNTTLGQDINYGALPTAGSTSGSFAMANGMFDDLSPTIQRQQGVAQQGQELSQQAMTRMSALLAQAMPTADDATRQRVEDALYSRASSRLDPQFSQMDNELRSTLMNRGIVENSDAWRNQMDSFGRNRTDAYSSAMWDAIAHGGQEQSRLLSDALGIRNQNMRENIGAAGMGSQSLADLTSLTNSQTGQNRAISDIARNNFDMQNQERTMNLTEQERARARVLNELNALRSGTQVQMPTFQANGQAGATQPANYQGAVQNQYQGQLGQYQADVGSANSTNSGLMSLAGTLGAGAMSSGFGAAALAMF